MAQVISKIFSDKLTVVEVQKVIDVCARLNINPNWLLAVMYFETARTLSPSKTNSIGSVGLIQFTRDKKGVEYKTINGVQYSLASLGQMSFVQQMDVVEVYLKQVIKSVGKSLMSFDDTYFAVFFPNAIGKAENYIFQTSGLSASLIATQNPAFDTDKNNQIVKSEVTAYFRKLYGQIFDTEINVLGMVKNAVEKISTFLVLPVSVFFYTFYTLNVVIN